MLTLFQRCAIRKTGSTHPPLSSVLERDDIPEPELQPTIDEILSTPNGPPETALRERIAQLSAIQTPRTLPRVAHKDMNPKDGHQTTANPPHSGFRLGFADISAKDRRSLASIQNSPTVSRPHQSQSPPLMSRSFEFKFVTESKLSDEAQKLMENVRDEAARIKAQMLAEKNEQDGKDDQAAQLGGSTGATGRRIAQAKGKAGRFSDIHMAEFKKMDSIANHVSSFRAQPSFARPTTQSLKRSGSKAGLDEPERPRTAGKGTPRKPAPFFMAPASASPFKSLSTTKNACSSFETPSSVKRMRHSESHDASGRGPTSSAMPDHVSKQSGAPLTKPPLPYSVFSPTESSLARSASTKIPTLSPDKKSSLPRSNSVRSLKGVFEAVRAESAEVLSSPTPHVVPLALKSKLLRLEGTKSTPAFHPITVPAPIPLQNTCDLTDCSSMKNHSAGAPKTGGLASRLPTFTGLKSILRPSRAPATKTSSSLTLDRGRGTPVRANTAVVGPGSAKKVDFTPSTKSRYAVKLAATTPSPSKASCEGAGSTPTTPQELYNSAAYTLDDDDEDWEDAQSEVTYPTLPSSFSAATVAYGPSSKTFSEKAKQHNRRESKEFKSIFTTLEHPSRAKPGATVATMATVPTRVNETKPTSYARIVSQSPSNTKLARPSPSTIRRVRNSSTAEPVQPFEDTINTVPHGLPGKKRRRESDKSGGLHGINEDTKENRQPSNMPHGPGGWDEDEKATVSENEENEGTKRGGKKAKVTHAEVEMEKMEVKKPKPNAAREAAAKNAKERKGKMKGVLSLSRLNMLARPKERV